MKVNLPADQTDDAARQRRREVAVTAALPHLQKLADKVLDLTGEMTTESLQHHEDDELGWMAVIFFFRQREHLRSLLALGKSRDCALIARSMIEGAAFLRWVFYKPEHEKQWRASLVKRNMEAMEYRKANGLPVEPEFEKRLKALFNSYGPSLLKKTAMAKPAPSLEDYHDAWHVNQVRQILDEVQKAAWDEHQEAVRKQDPLVQLRALTTEELDQARNTWSGFSKWHHWDSVPLADAIVEREGRLAYQAEAPDVAVLSLMSGIHAVYEVAVRVDRRLLQDKYLERLNELMAEWKATPQPGTASN